MRPCAEVVERAGSVLRVAGDPVSLDDYQVVIADWALREEGSPGDVIALEHKRLDGLCLVYSTTLGLTAAEIKDMCLYHEKKCEHARSQQPEGDTQ